MRYREVIQDSKETISIQLQNKTPLFLVNYNQNTNSLKEVERTECKMEPAVFIIVIFANVVALAVAAFVAQGIGG